MRGSSALMKLTVGSILDAVFLILFLVIKIISGPFKVL